METTAKRFNIERVLGDKGYLSKDNLEAAHDVGAVAFIPMKVDSQLREGDDTGTILWNKLFHFFGSHREDFLSLYHQRSNAETAVSMIKTRFQEHVRSRHPGGAGQRGAGQDSLRQHLPG